MEWFIVGVFVGVIVMMVWGAALVVGDKERNYKQRMKQRKKEERK